MAQRFRNFLPRISAPLLRCLVLLLSPIAPAEARTLSEVVHTQQMLIWAGFYVGLADGNADPATIDAAKKFQHSLRHEETGDLTESESAILEENGKARQSAAEYRSIVDDNIGIRLGIPRAYIPEAGTRTSVGTHWGSPQEGVAIDTFRIQKPASLAQVMNNMCCRQDRTPGRQITYKSVNADWFVLSGTDPGSNGRRTFYIIAFFNGSQTAGFAVKYDQSMHEKLWPVTLAMASDFALDPQARHIIRPGLPLVAVDEGSPEALASPPDSKAVEITALKEQIGTLQATIDEQRKKSIAISVVAPTPPPNNPTSNVEIAALTMQMGELRKALEAVKADHQSPTPSPPLPSPVAITGKRIALAIGINNYDKLPHAQQLRKAVNDARSMRTTLAGLGFEVLDGGDDVSQQEFYGRWEKFLEGIEPGGLAVLFYSGHGVQIENVNYLLPKDVPEALEGQEEFFKSRSLNLNRLLQQIRDRRPLLSFVVIDACRDNPYSNPDGKSISAVSKGLAAITLSKGLSKVGGQFVIFSAGDDEVALDRLPNESDDIPNSVFTRNLLPLLQTPKMTLQQVAIQVRQKVSTLASEIPHDQHPAYYDGIASGDFCLAGGCGGAP